MNVAFDNDEVKELCEEINLLDYAMESVEFVQKGNDNYAAHCPAHIDKTPSLFITPSKNCFHCFSCHKGGGIINWMMQYEGKTYPESVECVLKITGKELIKRKQSSALQFYKENKKITTQSSKPIIREILDYSVYEKYEKAYPIEWLDEGISKEAMDFFDIRIDNDSNRIIYPIYDKDFNLVGMKGRTRYKNYKIIGLNKYINYTKIGTTDFFVAMKENFHQIQENKKIIIFEGIKSVMKAWDFGYDFCVSAETSCLNEQQIKILISMGIKDITIAFDSDVKLSTITENMKWLKKFSTVYVIQDRISESKKLLGEKESPVDRGKEVFETLLRERKKI